MIVAQTVLDHIIFQLTPTRTRYTIPPHPPKCTCTPRPHCTCTSSLPHKHARLRTYAQSRSFVSMQTLPICLAVVKLLCLKHYLSFLHAWSELQSSSLSWKGSTFMLSQDLWQRSSHLAFSIHSYPTYKLLKNSLPQEVTPSKSNLIRATTSLLGSQKTPWKGRHMHVHFNHVQIYQHMYVCIFV
jgi:hypothetical protein